METVFTKSAFREFQRLDKEIQRRIREKLRFYVTQDDPLQFATPLQDSSLGDWRFRIGDYRVICDATRQAIVVLKVGHRKDIYR